jgi:hypothetical protein
LVGTLADRISVIEEIADGRPVKRAEVSLLAVLKHAHCPTCGDKLKPNPETTAADLAMLTLEGLESASPSDRLKAIDLAGKYGLGTQDTVTLVSPEVTDRLERQVQIIGSRETWTRAELLDALQSVWTT